MCVFTLSYLEYKLQRILGNKDLNLPSRRISADHRRETTEN